MRKFLFMMSFLVVACVSAIAQSKTITGTVTGDDGLPIPGASVVVKGTSNGTVTDIDGNYSLNVPSSDAILVFRFIGLKDLEVALAGQSKVSVKLSADEKLVDEVMVVAYGTAKKSSFTGAAATVKGDKLQKLQSSNLSKSLEGAVAGLQTASSSGTPGSSASIIIRGLGSISSSQSPLIVVDGVPYEGSLNSISAQDIESMTVLKDAAANSMYGARGSNGVIIVTTKGSKSGEAKVNVEARYGFNARAVPNYDIVTEPGEYYEMMYEAYKNSLVADMGYAGAADYAAKNLVSELLKYNIYADVADDALIDPTTGKLNPNAKKRKWSDDWSEDPFENGVRQEYNVNVSGGSDKTKAYASFGYLSDEGYMVGSKFDRISARVKVDQEINKYVKIGGNIAYANTKYRVFGSTGSNYSNIFMFSQNIAPIYPIYMYDADGNKMYDENGKVRYDFGTEYQRPYASEQNPLAVAKENIEQSITDNLSSRGYLEAKFLKDFKFTLNVAYDVFNSNSTEFATPIGGDAANVGGRGYKTGSRYAALNINQLLNWSHSFDLHNVSVLVGHETKNDQSSSLSGQMTGFADPSNPEFSNATVYQWLSSSTSEYALEGYLGKAEYDYADKYYLSASLRKDGSSRFHKDVRWGSFWSVGASWRIKEESFLKDVDAVSSLKIKASYGTQGNDNIPVTRSYTDLYSVDRVDGSAALTKVLRGNKDLTWEKSNNFNAGIELGLFDRVTVNADFFIKETKDMLYQSPLASSEGTPSFIWRNEMDMKNTGIEFEVSADVLKSNDFKWNVSFNGTHYKNELTRLPASKPAEDFPDGYQAGSYWRKLGGSLYDFYQYEYVGVDEATGKPLYNKYVTDAEGNESIVLVNTTSEASLRQTGKSAIPALTGGISTTFEAYGFDVSLQAAYQIGGYVYDSYYSSLMNAGEAGSNFHKDMFNRWTPTHTKTDIPALMYGDRNYAIGGDYFLTKASYFSLRNVTVGYSLPKSILDKVGVERFRIYLTGDNIFLQSKRKGLDPRQSFSGSTGYVYSALSSYSIGLNLTF